jgi:hypothetical protein
MVLRDTPRVVRDAPKSVFLVEPWLEKAPVNGKID